MFEGRMLLPERSKYWWVELLAGIGWLVIAWLVLRANVTSLATVGLLLGVLFLAAGLNEAFVGTMVGGGWKVLHWVVAVIFLLGGLWALIRPVNTFFALVSVLGLVLLLEGAFEIVRGGRLARRESVLVAGSRGRHPAHPARPLGVRFGPHLQPAGARLPGAVLGRPDGADPRRHGDRPGLRDPAGGSDAHAGVNAIGSFPVGCNVRPGPGV
jgi:uncharacterized membrane protein HdeD (DUF308 family)